MRTKTIFWQAVSIVLALTLVMSQASPAASSWLVSIFNKTGTTTSTIVQSVDASEIYPLFTCPCCGQPLNKEEPCCGAMQQMIDFIDDQVSENNQSKDEVILATAMEFGIDRLTSAEDQVALKQKLAELAPEDAPQIQLSETQRDLGEIGQSQGEVSTDFSITNQGQTDLVIDKLSSSCGCTSAAIVYLDEEGPRFTMPGHGTENPVGWSVAIKPGGTATLRVYYDPTVHPDLVGAVTRTVSIFSNDPVEFESKITITLDQVP